MQTFMFIGAALAGIVVVFIVGQLMLVHKMKRQQGKPAPGLTGKPEKWIRSGKPALFYFYSPSCGACREMTPVVRRLEKKHKGVFAVDISQDMETARKFGVMATPTTIQVTKGIIRQVLIGPQPPSEIEQLAHGAA
jgi:thioredoxin 1